jgi:ATP-dependent Clp protease protease subunit
VKRFWDWVKNETEGEKRTLRLYGVIAEEGWLGDEATPRLFREELLAGAGDIDVWIHSPGGEAFAAAQIYNMLMDYKGKVTVKIDGLAASAASVVAMAGSRVLMSPVSVLMVHRSSIIAAGDSEEMLRAKALLDEVDESVANAYELKTGLPRAKIARMMAAETWMSAYKAVELGFADEVMFTGDRAPQNFSAGFVFSRQAADRFAGNFIGGTGGTEGKPGGAEDSAGRVPVEPLLRRLNLLRR